MNSNEVLRKLPQVDEILKSKDLSFIVTNLPHDFLVNCIREVLMDTRANVLNGITKDINESEIIQNVLTKIDKKSKPSLRRVINATGTVLHTNLGRAVVSKKATEAIINHWYIVLIAKWHKLIKLCFFSKTNYFIITCMHFHDSSSHTIYYRIFIIR